MASLVFWANFVAAVMWAAVAIMDSNSGGAMVAAVLAGMHTIICINVFGDLF